jgi:hypothetical protein
MSGVTSRVVISAFLLLVGAAIIDQVNKKFVPRVSVVRAGTMVSAAPLSIPLAIDVDSASATVAAWPE